MRRILFILFIEISLLPLAARDRTDGVRLPLDPVVMDSVRLQDFFWRDIQKNLHQDYPTAEPVDWKDAGFSVKAKHTDTGVMPVSLTGSARRLPSGVSPLRSALDCFWSAWREHLRTGQSRFIDLMERALYNDILGRWQDAASDREKQEAIRAMLSVSGTIYSTSGDHVFLNAYIQSDTHIHTRSFDGWITMNTETPWYSGMQLHFDFGGRSPHMVLHLRIPSFLCDSVLPGYAFSKVKSSYTCSINAIPLLTEVRDGYIVIDRVWNDSDNLHILFPTPIRRIIPADHPQQMTLQRSHFVYFFQGLPAGMTVRESDPVKFELDRKRGVMLLSSDYYDAAGHKAGRYTALPFFRMREEADAQMMAPLN